MSELNQYHYDLPKELIAQFPVKERADARLLVVNRATNRMDHWHVRDLPEILSAHDCLVLNNSRVLPARLVGFRTSTQGRWQGLFLEASPDGLWKMLCKTRGRLAAGETVQVVDRDARPSFQLLMGNKLEDGIWVARPTVEEDAMTLLEASGRVPLPPYIRGGEMVDSDVSAYQTVYADQPGSVAAPTAGLHFTRPLLDKLSLANVSSCQVTLHVGRGTFRPLTAEHLEDHRMHSEWGSIEAGTVDQLQNARSLGGRAIAVGTTSLRVLETAAMSGTLSPWKGHTDLFVRPPFQFHGVDALLTNFHLPRTSLLVLVAAFAGKDLIRRAYDEAIAEKYRFYSYGDTMLIL
mgnify:CR=1 FL=1